MLSVTSRVCQTGGNMSCMYVALVIMYQIIRRQNPENQSLGQNEHGFKIPCLESYMHA